MHKQLRAISFSILVFLVASCGGSGGGTAAEPPIVTSKAVINSGNAQSISSSSANAAFAAGSFGAASDVVGLTASQPGGTTNTNSAIANKGSNNAQVPVGPITEVCAVSGSVTITGDIANPMTITPGDFFDTDWDQCDDGIGIVTDGLLGLTIDTFEGDAASKLVLLETELRIEEFRVTAGDNFENVDGDVNLSLDTRPAPVTIAITSGDALTLSNNSDTETLSNFSTSVTQDATVIPATITTDAIGTVSSTQFTGDVTYTTPVVFEALGDNYPHSGELLVSGADNATVRLIAVDEVNVRIEADYDGDGSIDETINTTWDELL